MTKYETIWPHPFAACAIWMEIWTAWTTAFAWWLPHPLAGGEAVQGSFRRAAGPPDEAVWRSGGTFSSPGLGGQCDRGSFEEALDGSFEHGVEDTEAEEPRDHATNGHAAEIASGIELEEVSNPLEAVPDVDAGGSALGEECEETGESSATGTEEGDETPEGVYKPEIAGSIVLTASDGLSSAVVFGEVPSYSGDDSLCEAVSEAACGRALFEDGGGSGGEEHGETAEIVDGAGGGEILDALPDGAKDRDGNLEGDSEFEFECCGFGRCRNAGNASRFDG